MHPGALRKPGLPGAPPPRVPPPCGASRLEPGSRRVRRPPGLGIAPVLPQPCGEQSWAAWFWGSLRLSCTTPLPTPSAAVGFGQGGGWRALLGELDPPLFASCCARGGGRVFLGCLASLRGPRKAATGRRVIARQVWGCPLCVCVHVPEAPLERPGVGLWALLPPAERRSLGS